MAAATTPPRETDVEALKGQIDSLQKELASLTKTVSEAAKHEYERDKKAVTEYAKEAASTLYETVEAHPERSLLVAFGAGFLFGLISRR
ncbi:hypothetical protein FKB34_04590 [Glycocaulis profundi]|nr:hypothetical protein FKB34_04590 [Glycocaulis profundi]